MGLYQNSNDDLSALISSQLGQTVTSSQYSVLGIRATTSADEPASNGANTKVAIQMGSTANLQGEAAVFFNRLNLSQLSQYSPYALSAQVGADISTLLTTIFNMYGILFTMADLEDATSVQAEDGVHVQVTLTAQANSLGYTGTFTVTFAPLPNISTAFYSSILPGF